MTDEDLNERLATIAPNKCASLVYTVCKEVLIREKIFKNLIQLKSGTTGQPKAAMMSHDNIHCTADFFMEILPCKMFNERMVSFLPLR